MFMFSQRNVCLIISLPCRALSFFSHCCPIFACLTIFLLCLGVLPRQPTAAQLLERSLTPTHLRLSRLQIRSYFWSKQQMRLAGNWWCICSVFPSLGRPSGSDQLYGSVRETSIESVLKDPCRLWFISQRGFLQSPTLAGSSGRRHWASQLGIGQKTMAGQL